MAEFEDNTNETQPKNLGGLSDDKLTEYYEYFALFHRTAGDSSPEARRKHRAASERMNLLQGEVDRRQAMRLGTKTLKWAKIAGWAAIAAATVALITLGVQTCFSTSQRATPAQASPLSLPKTTATISESPVPEATASIAMPSPQPTETESPLATP